MMELAKEISAFYYSVPKAKTSNASVSLLLREVFDPLRLTNHKYHSKDALPYAQTVIHGLLCSPALFSVESDTGTDLPSVYGLNTRKEAKASY